MLAALPPVGTVKIGALQLNYKGSPLRLYCLVLSDEVVVLFNGGIKFTIGSGKRRYYNNEVLRG